MFLNLSLNKKLRKIVHNYHVQTTQTYKFTETAYKSLKSDLSKINNLLKDDKFLKAYKTYIEKEDLVSKELQLKKKDKKKIFLFVYGEKNLLEKIPPEYRNDLTIIKLTKEEFEIHEASISSFLSISRSKSLLNMTFIYLMTLLEAFHKDFLFELFSNKPDLLKTKEKHIDDEMVLECNAISELHQYLANQEIDKMGYMNIDQFSKYLENKFKSGGF